MSQWLVTGGTGFIGGHVLRALAAGAGGGCDVIAAGRRRPEGWGPRAFVAADLEDPTSVARAVRIASPDVVIHAAGRTPPGGSGDFDRANVRSTLHLLDALRRERRPVRVVLVGSAAEVGPVASPDAPVAEDHPCRPTDAYGWSKLLATYAGLLASRPPLDVVVARVFNPYGPGAPEATALGSLAARLLSHGQGPFHVRDLDVKRDFIDVRDVASALVALGLRGAGGSLYHVGTGTPRRLGDGLDRLLHRAGRAIDVREASDPSTVIRASRADISRIVAETGWRPTVSWEQGLDDLWDAAAARSRGALPLTA